MPKKGLGKGLGTLFESDSVPEIIEESKDISETKINLIEPNKNQPRKSFDPEKIEALAQSILENGLIQPIVITPQGNGRYKIVAGERRWRAAKKAGLKTVPTVIKDYTEEQIAEIALVENLQREDLNPIEEALGYKTLIEEYSLTQEAVSQKVGKSRSAVANSMRLLALSDKLQKLLINGDLTGGHARALLAVEDEKARELLADVIIKDSLNVRQAEAMAKQLNKPKTPPVPKNDAVAVEIQKLQERLSSDFGTKVKISHGKKRGKIEIEYYGNDDLDRILSIITGGRI